MVLNNKCNSISGSYFACHLQTFNNHCILFVKRDIRPFISGIYPYHIGSQVACKTGKFSNIDCLYLDIWNSGFINTCCEIIISGNANQFESQFFNSCRKFLTCCIIVID